MGKALSDDVRRHKNQSGFVLLSNAVDSLRIRLAMVQAAEKSLDLQYYIVHDDAASSLMLEALLRAAERGVRIRFLIDGITLREAGENLAILDHRKNIEIRVFNPIVKPGTPLLARLRIGFIDWNKAGKRMHNKSIITDNWLAVTGGRNIGDEYFDEAEDFNFKDLDTLVAGPVTDQMSRSFDQYWNDENAYPIGQLRPSNISAQTLENLRKDMQKNWDEKLQTEEGRVLLESNLPQRLKKGHVHLEWASAELVVDSPEKIEHPGSREASKPLQRLLDLAAGSRNEINAVSAYFVPREFGVAALKSLVDRGVKVRVLTNALAATDVVAVHTGYRRYRKELVENGIELYEFKPVGGKRPKQRLMGSSAPPRASLHSKVYTVDGKDLVVGSYNLDPRSTRKNTEIAIVIHSPSLTAQMNKLFNESIDLEQSYRIITTSKGIRWLTRENGKEVIYDHEPGAGMGRRIQVELMSLLPIEEQL